MQNTTGLQFAGKKIELVLVLLSNGHFELQALVRVNEQSGFEGVH
jgi:hypothetical protein